jgi:hypothetical protein
LELQKTRPFCTQNKTVAKLSIQKYSRLDKFLIRNYLIDNEESEILTTKKIEVE